MNEKMKEFLLKTFAIIIAIIIVLFFINYWIFKPLKEINNITVSSSNAEVKKHEWREKENIKIDWKDAGKYVGKYIITEGEIISSYNNGKVCFLNFHKDYKNHLSLVIFASSFRKFPENPEKYYLGKKVRVEGRIKIYNERLEIILESQDQIRIMK